MFPYSDRLDEAEVWLAIVLWLLLSGIYFIGRRGASSKTEKRSVVSQAGFALQIVAYAVAYIFHRPLFTPFFAMPKVAEAILLMGATAVGVWSIWFCYAAARALGKQWALTARVIEGHELIDWGPYRVVRNPIYLGMFGLLLNAGITVARWGGFVAAIAIFLLGTWIRISSEEKVLREAFGSKFDNYARRVPAFFPRFG